MPTAPSPEAVANAPDLDAGPAARTNNIRVDHDAPMCYSCGIKMKRAGSCHVCESCGTTSGCS